MKHTPAAELSLSLDLGVYGGAETFFADINHDGVKEIIAYQGPGVFGARLYSENPKLKAFIPKHTSVSAFTLDGERLWTWGEPNPPEQPYVAHSAEACVSVADIDDDGTAEVVVALGDAVVALDGKTGKEKYSVSMPEDYFYILHALQVSSADSEARVVVKNGEVAYQDTAPYGQPVFGLSSSLKSAWGPKQIPGGGHHILTIPLPGGSFGYLIGYCAVHPAGNIVWTADAIEPDNLSAYDQHVDLTDYWSDANGRYFYALACGTNQGHLIADDGKTIFSMSGEHIQGVAAGRFIDGKEHQIAFYDCRKDVIMLYDINGKQLWQSGTARFDASGQLLNLTMPSGKKYRFHRNRPLVTVRGSEHDWIGYADGGWPWGMNGSGKITLSFPAPMELPAAPWENYPEMAHLRLDDIGFGYAMQAVELEARNPLTMIYNRRYIWGYKSKV